MMKELLADPAAFAVIVSALGLMLTILRALFGVNWLSSRPTDRLIDQLEKRLADRDKVITAEFNTVNTKLDSLAEKVTRLEKLLETFVKLVVPKWGA